MSKVGDVAHVEKLGPEELALEKLRHSAAHVMAQAVRSFWPGTKLAIGPTVEHGFYYDMEIPGTVAPEDLERIEAEMRRIAEADHAFERDEWDKPRARAFFEDAPFKLEIIDGIEDATVSIFTQGDFTDLCEGPHLDRTSQLRHFKLTSIAGAYWRGDEKNAMLTRIYGVAFQTKDELDRHLERLEQAKLRDHRKLGKELGLFSFHPEAPAMPFFHPKGAVLVNQLQAYIRELYGQEGYSEVITPQIFDTSLWHRSGHWELYREALFLMEIDERQYGAKPMNCPAHCLMFSEGKWSYRDLPVRFADFGRLHRYERSGVTQGLTRVRALTQDDAHIFCTPDQIRGEIERVIRMIRRVYGDLGLGAPRVFLATKPEKALGSAEIWEKAETALREVLDASGFAYEIEAGEGAFYGPKIDFFFEDAIGRRWQLSTIQLDFNLPERFDLAYTTPTDERARPVIIHRAVLGTFERFLGVYIEHCAGAFPPWLAPVQVKALPINDDLVGYAQSVADRLQREGVRVEVDARSEKLGKKIRDAQLAKIPWQLVIGKREAEEGLVSVRLRQGGDVGAMTLDAFVALATGIVRSRALSEAPEGWVPAPPAPKEAHPAGDAAAKQAEKQQRAKEQQQIKQQQRAAERQRGRPEGAPPPRSREGAEEPS
jgi:threonyl-tRNA synthetase